MILPQVATYNKLMLTLHLVPLLLLLVGSSFAQWSTCPNGNSLNIVQGSLTVSQSGNIPLTQGKDVQCYNYTLTSAFQSTPNVAIAVTQFQSQYSPDLFFTIKVSASDSYQMIPFIVRTQWKYTRWSRINFNFVAQTSSQIEAGFYQVETSTLSSCVSGKQIVAFLPIQNQGVSMTSALTFLNGFQISSIAPNMTYLTPFEVSVIVSSVTTQGITLVIQSTSATEIHSLFISFIAYNPSIQNLVVGTYKYNQYNPVNYLQFTPSQPVAGNNLAFHGFSSFMLRNVQTNFDLRADLQNSQLSFSSSSAIQYMTYGYFFLVGGPCGQCQGYSISYLGQCVSSCPTNTYKNGSTCVSCQTGFSWNGTNCVYRCPTPQVWNANLNSCSCPSGQNWNGNTCISCAQGQIWNISTQSCTCSGNSNWNGFVCITCNSGQIWNSNSMNCECPPGTGWNGWTCLSCPQGQIWSTQQNQCACPSGQNWNGNACIICGNGLVWNNVLNACGCSPGYVLFRGSCSLVPTCTVGQVLDTNSNTCVCTAGANWNGFNCITCNNGQIWLNNQCQCPTNTFWNSYSCVSCPPGQFWSSSLNSCSCPRGQNWDGFNCITCNGGRSWNPNINSCACQPGQNWNGNQCITCNIGANWNGFSCVTCPQGQQWNSVSSICECPSGQQWNGSSCILPCSSGMTNINGVCTCPSGTTMINGACRTQPSCPSGQTWNGTQCASIQCPVGTFWSQNQCIIIPPITCPASTYFDGLQCSPNSTYCPAGTQWNGTYCSSTGTCPNGTYSSGGTCVPIFQLCPVGFVWQNNRCVVTNNQCPQGSYFIGGSCIPIQPCSNGKVWSTTHSQCICPSTTFWNGNICMQCNSGQIYQSYLGCFCPLGTYLNNTSCVAITISQCASISNALWSGNKCLCNHGFSQVGLQCACEGLIVNSSFCDRCYTKPNSKWVNGTCQCNPGYAQISGKCQQLFPNPNPPATSICNVGTYWDDQQKRCLPCSSGCLSCITCYECTSCRPGFYMNYASALCVEMCGDGKRFTLECDDGNNNNGDGCSSDCKIERGYSCVDGSPNSRDSCTMTLPSALIFTATGQAHLYGKIVLNVKVNYLPQELIKSASDCANKCNSVLAVKIVSGDMATTGIKASYVPTTSYSFSIEMQFGREPIGLFTVQVGINQNLVQKYFSGINTGSSININVNPAFLSLYTGPSASNANGDILE